MFLCPYHCFLTGLNYIYTFACATYVTMRCIRTSLRKLHHSGGLGQLMGVVCYRTHIRALQYSPSLESRPSRDEGAGDGQLTRPSPTPSSRPLIMEKLWTRD